MDIRLIKQATRGNKKAFGILIQEVKIDGYKMAYYYMKNEADSKDVLCCAIEKTYMNIRKLKDLEKFKQWFLTIVVNEAKQLLRVRLNIKIISLDEIIEEKRNGKELVSEDDRIDLENALDELNSDDKVLILMKHYEGYTFKEIGEILSIPESTVKTRNYTLLKQLKRALEVKEVNHG